MSCAVLPSARPGQRRRQRDQGPHQPERRPGADEHSRAGEAALGVEVEVGERLVELMLAPSVRACSRMNASVAAIAGLRAIPPTARRGAGAVVLQQRLRGPARRRSWSAAKPAPAPAAQLDHVAAELVDDQREREQRQDQHRHLQRAGDVEDRLVDAVGGEREERRHVVMPAGSQLPEPQRAASRGDRAARAPAPRPSSRTTASAAPNAGRRRGADRPARGRRGRDRPPGTTCTSGLAAQATGVTSLISAPGDARPCKRRGASCGRGRWDGRGARVVGAGSRRVRVAVVVGVVDGVVARSWCGGLGSARRVVARSSWCRRVAWRCVAACAACGLPGPAARVVAAALAAARSGSAEFRTCPRRSCLCRPGRGGGRAPTVIGIEAPPPPPAASVTCTVTVVLARSVERCTCGAGAWSRACAVEVQLYDEPGLPAPVTVALKVDACRPPDRRL